MSWLSFVPVWLGILVAGVTRPVPRGMAHLYVERRVREAFLLNPLIRSASAHMAIYHCAAKVISRSQGRSAVAAAAYRAGCNLHDERLGLDYKYARKKGVTHSAIMAPPVAPAWVFEREVLWNQVEAAEKRKDSQLARDFDFALPVELTPADRLLLIQGFVQEQFVDRGMVADYSIHEDNPQNPHCHLMTTMRTIDAEGFGLKARDWNHKDLLQEQRVAWSEHVNRALEQAGHDARVDHRSLKDQGVDDRLPQIHLGVAATGMIERAAKNETLLEHPRVDRLQEIQQFNDRVAELDREIAEERARLEAAAKTAAAQLEQQRQAWGQEVAFVAVSALKVAGKTSYDALNYCFVFDGGTLTVEAKDGRGVLVMRQGNELFVSDQITEADRDYFRAQGQALQQRLQTMEVRSQTAKDKTAGLDR